MTYIGEYYPPMMQQPHNEADPHLKEFRNVRHFPALRSICPKTSQLEDTPVQNIRMAPVAAPRNAMVKEKECGHFSKAGEVDNSYSDCFFVMPTRILIRHRER